MIEIKLIHRPNKDHLFCPFFVCDVCGETITQSGNYEYQVNQDSTTGPVYLTHKKCSHVLEILLGKEKMIYSGELRDLPAQLWMNFADTDLTTDSPLSMYCYAFGLKFEDEIRGAGIYFLFDNEELTYIGQSKNVVSRLGNNHHVYIKDTHKIKFAPVYSDEDREAIERALIVLLKPPLNVVYLK